MKELSPKSAIFAVFCMVILGSCVPTGGATDFVNDPEVKDYVEYIEEVVKVIDLTGDNLRGRYGRIEGFDSSKYYMVEKETYEDKEMPGYPKYATDDPKKGPVLGDLGSITKIKRGTVYDLENFHTYTVRAAERFANGNLMYTEISAGNYKPVTNGVINIGGVTATGSLNLSTVLSGTYKVIGVSVDGISNLWGGQYKTLSNWNSFTLESPDTETDYVFVKDDLSDFKVLTVIVGPLLGPAKTIDLAAIQGVTAPKAFETPVLTITQTIQYTGTVQWSPAVGSGGTFAPGIDYTATITLTARTGYTLAGVTSNFFTVTDASTVSNSANSGVIIAKFPKTDTPPGTAKFNVTFTFADQAKASADNGAASVPKDTISRGDLLSGNTVTLTLAPPSGGGSWTSYTWEIPGISSTVINNHLGATNGNGKDLDINNSADFKDILLPGSFNVHVLAYLGTMQYSAIVPITVVP